MKNKAGWGLAQMLVLCGILIAFLLLIVILVNQLYSGLESIYSDKNGYEYEQIERNVEESSKKYFQKHKDKSYVDSDELILESFLSRDELMPYNKENPCIGYTIKEKEAVLKTYISCEDYETEGY